MIEFQWEICLFRKLFIFWKTDSTLWATGVFPGNGGHFLNKSESFSTKTAGRPSGIGEIFAGGIPGEKGNLCKLHKNNPENLASKLR